MGKNLLIWKKCPEECDDQLSLLYDYCPYCGAKLEINYPSTDTPTKSTIVPKPMEEKQ